MAELGDDDLLALERAGAQAMSRGHWTLDPSALEADCARHGLDHDRWFAALRSLQAARLVVMAWVAPSLVSVLELTDAGVAEYVERCRPDLPHVRARLAAELARRGRRPGAVVRPAASLGEPALLVEVLLQHLRAEQLVTYSTLPGGAVRLHHVAEELGRR